jgi:hypothetical protein
LVDLLFLIWYNISERRHIMKILLVILVLFLVGCQEQAVVQSPIELRDTSEFPVWYRASRESFMSWAKEVFPDRWREMVAARDARIDKLEPLPAGARPSRAPSIYYVRPMGTGFVIID